jgi:hypothetical protein
MEHLLGIALKAGDEVAPRRGRVLTELAFCLDHGDRPQALPFGQGVD